MSDCHPLNACDGGSQCAEGLAGVRCTTLLPGYFSAVGIPVLMPAGGEAQWAVSVGVPISLMLLWLPLIELASSPKRGYEAISVLLFSVQCLSEIGRFALRWPTSVHRTLRFLSFFGLDLSLSVYSFSSADLMSFPDEISFPL